MNPARGQKRQRAGRKPVREAAVQLLRIVAEYGHDDVAEAERAFGAGMRHFGDWGEAYGYEAGKKVSTAELEKSIDQLVALNAEGRRMLLDSVTSVVMHDDQLTVAEAELVRTICASLEIPLPPQIGVSLNSVPESGSQ